MSHSESADKAITDKINSDIDWMNPYWLDEIKDEYSDIPENTIDEIYNKRLKEKVDSLSKEELRKIHSEQGSETSANQNFLLQNIIEEKLSLV